MTNTTTLTFTDDQLVTLDRAIGDLPYKDAAPLVAAINQQIKAAADREAADLDEQRNRNRDETNALPVEG